MKSRNRGFLLGIAVIIVFWLIWSRLRIHFWIHLSGWQALITFGVAVLAIFLVLEHLVNRTR
ncbi:MAG: hypothetical protein PVF45_06185 [Anaerolineae bacterium]|jgi:hypothetical protein